MRQILALVALAVTLLAATPYALAASTEGRVSDLKQDQPE
jgi:hypothetical protein